MSLRLRLILIVVSSLVLVLTVHGVIRMAGERGQLIQTNQRNLALTAKALRVAVESLGGDGLKSEVRQLLLQMVEGDGAADRIRLFRIRVFDRNLMLTFESNPLAIGDAVPAAALLRVLETGREHSFHEPQGTELVFYHLAPLSGDAAERRGVIEVVQLARELQAALAGITSDLWLRLGLVVVAVTAVTAIALQRQILDPLARLLSGIHRVSEGQLEPSLPVVRHDELGRLALAFNQMGQRLKTARQELVTENERAVQLERQLRHADSLAVAGRLASDIAHEIGTPLNIVSGRAEILLETLSRDDERRRDLTAIIEQIDRITTVIRSLLDTVRSQVPEVRAVALTDVLDRLWPLMEPAARRRGLRLVASVPRDLPPLRADPKQLQQVLINVLVNALEASPRNSETRLTAAALARGPRDGVAIAISDNGSGIPAGGLARVFDPFFTTKPAGHGTGLGLAISRDIVRAHGGDITIASRENEGTTVTVWLPRATGDET
ncbi:MAG: ATP-binding protein [Candidatus Rokuibacteriota bacterium]